MSEPTDDRDARNSVQWAAQLAVSVQKTLLQAPAEACDSGLFWRPATSTLVTEALPGGDRVGLRVNDFTLVTLHERRTLAELPLHRQTYADALAWLETLLGVRGLERPRRALPPHAVQNGGPFGAPLGEALSELGTWFSNGQRILETVELGHPWASPIRCWPRRFGVAALLRVGATGAPVAVGMSPGDHRYDEPYYYVAPRRPPRNVILPKLELGARWHSDGWVGAVLTRTDLDSRGHTVHAQQFVQHAVAVVADLLAQDASVRSSEGR